MGPTDEALSCADYVIRECGLAVDRYTLAYAFMGWCDQQDALDDAGEATP